MPKGTPKQQRPLARTTRGTGTGVASRACSTRASRSTAWAEARMRPGGFLRKTHACPPACAPRQAKERIAARSGRQ